MDKIKTPPISSKLIAMKVMQSNFKTVNEIHWGVIAIWC